MRTRQLRLDIPFDEEVPCQANSAPYRTAKETLCWVAAMFRREPPTREQILRHCAPSSPLQMLAKAIGPKLAAVAFYSAVRQYRGVPTWASVMEHWQYLISPEGMARSGITELKAKAKALDEGLDPSVHGMTKEEADEFKRIWLTV